MSLVGTAPADGRFVMVEPGPDERLTQLIHITLNWPAMLK